MLGLGVGVLQVLQQASSRCSRENPLPILTRAPEGQHTSGRLGSWPRGYLRLKAIQITRLEKYLNC